MDMDEFEAERIARGEWITRCPVDECPTRWAYPPAARSGVDLLVAHHLAAQHVTVRDDDG